MASPFGIFGIGGKPKSYLGIDIGTLSIKIVELSSEGGRPKLENYGILENFKLIEKPAQSRQAFGGEAVSMLIKLLKEAGTVSRRASMSVPIFSSFLTIMELPPMPEEEVVKAIQFEARKYIPVPLDSVALDWSLIGLNSEGKIQVMLVAIPKELIDEYALIAKETGLELLSIELETVSAARALVGNDPVPAVLIDMGARETTVSVIDGGYLRISHAIETSGEDLTKALARSLNISERRAEELKKASGLKVMDSGNQVAGVLTPLMDVVVAAVLNIIDVYYVKSKKRVEKAVIYGGAAKMPDFAEYLQKSLKIETSAGNAFSRIVYSEKLTGVIDEIGHEFTVAAGLALKSLQ